MKKNYKPFNRLVVTSLFVTLCSLSFAAQFPVTNTNDVGAGSLSVAIASANSTPGTDTITFALTEGGSMTIALATGLPAITEAVFIDGYSQPGSAMGPIASRTIRVNVNGAGITVGSLDVFTISVPNVTIAGLAIYGAPAGGAPTLGHGIKIESGGTAFIWGNYIGTDSTGLATGLGNNQCGVVSNIFNGTPNGGLTIGVNGDNLNDANEGNLISCNGQDAVFLWVTSNSKISGNIIGFDKNGVGTGFGNGRNGILVTLSSNSNTIGTNGDGLSDNLEGNRIGNNNGRGIFLASVSNSNIIAGNIIGLNAANAAAGNLGVDGIGIEIYPGSGNRIGTNGDGLSDASERNTICANAVDGIRITGGTFFTFASNSDGNIIAGNAIGTDGAGTLVMGNAGNGILIQTDTTNFNANDNIIGTNEDGDGDDVEGNLIANNLHGIVIATPGGASTHVGNRIGRNSIFDNTQLGIDLGNDGVSANDNGDTDSGPNELYNFPIIKKSNVQAGNLVITGIAPAGAFMEFYIADANGSEGKTYLFSAIEGSVIDDSAGTDSYTDVTYGTFTDQKYGFTIPVGFLLSPVTAGTVIIAVAINTENGPGNAAEFGPSFISTLPVRLLQFNGRVDNGIVYLNWNTSQEINNSHFDVERSSNGTSFEKIGTVAARGGISNAYSFNDTKAGTVNFYRLKQVDKNGASTYSKTVLIRGDLDKIVAKVSPNPFRGSVNVSFQSDKEETVTIRLFSQTGQLVKQQSTKINTGINTVNLGDLNNLPAGNYTLELRGETINFKQQVVKQ